MTLDSQKTDFKETNVSNLQVFDSDSVTFQSAIKCLTYLYNFSCLHFYQNVLQYKCTKLLNIIFSSNTFNLFYKLKHYQNLHNEIH